MIKYIKHKNNNTKSYRLLYCLCALVFGVSCETVELEKVVDPNGSTLENSSVDNLFNGIQENFADFFEQVNEFGMETTRMTRMNGPLYANAYSPSDFDLDWQLANADVISNIRVIKSNIETSGATAHLGASQILEAYIIITLTDIFGDIPYSEAFKRGNNLNPKPDKGADIYQSIFKLLDEAIANLNAEEAVRFGGNDLFYGGNKDKWIKLANTLKLRMWLQTKLVNAAASTAGVKAILAAGNYIKETADDFQFQHGTEINNPDSRHPYFGRNFDRVANVEDYMSNHFMTELNTGYIDKNLKDPRIRYYIYRQSPRNAKNTIEQDCFGSLPPAHYGFDIPFCTTKFQGYWGRDHGDDAGVPPDGGSRAIWGLYPVGGLFDDNSFKPIPGQNIGTKGAGISPILLASWVDFMIAEAILTLDVTGNAESFMESGINKSINKVINFRPDLVNPTYVPSSQQIADYIADVKSAYASANDDQKLHVVINEWYKAAFGNGIESYNFYRRTGKPDNLQPNRTVQSDFLRSALYPENLVSNNSNISQKPDVFQRVFWDTNPAGFIK